MSELNLKLTLNSNGSITANWDSVANLVRYTALIYQIGKSTAIVNEQNWMTNSITTPANLAAGQQYQVTISAVRSSGYTLSDGKSILIPSGFYDNVPLDVPQNVKATATTNSVTVSFSSVVRATSYDILFDNVVSNTTATSKTFSGLSPKTTHTYAVRAKNTKQTGSYSTTQSIQTLAQAPAVPSGIKKSATDSTVTISWNAVSGATGYDLLFNGSTYSVSTNTRTFTGLASATSFSFQVRSKNADASSAYTSSNTVTTAPKAPTTITATSTDTTATITWTAMTGATGYTLRFNNSDIQIASTTSQYTITGLNPNTSYAYQMCSKSADGSSAFSTSRTIKTAVKKPAIPTNIVKSATETTATISWGAVSDATGYIIVFNGTTYSVTSTSKTFTGLTAGKGYAFKLCSTNSSATGDYSSEYTVTTPAKAPTTVSATSTDKSITVTWSAVSGAAGYKVKCNDVYATAVSTATSCTVSNLTPNTSYTYQVCCTSVDGEGSYSTAKTIKTQVEKPAAPAILTRTSTENSAKITWSPVSGATGYTLLFNNRTYSLSSSTTSYTVTGLSANTAYEFQMRTINSGATGDYGTVYKITTTPYAPSNASATADEKSATVTWGAVTGATNYDLLFNNIEYNTSLTSKTVTGLSANTSYTYQVRSRNADGMSSYSSSKTVRTTPTAPAAPTEKSTQTSITITWPAVSGATSYDIEFNGTVYTVTTNSKTFSNLTPGTSYTYRVRSNNAYGSSSYSSQFTVKTLPNPPAVPTGVTVSNITTTSLTVKWNASSGATGYEVSVNNLIYSSTSTSITITGLSSNTSYTCRVRAKNDGGTSAYSTSVVVKTLLAAPPTPTNITATATYNTATVSWSASKDASEYEIQFNGTTYTTTSCQKTFTGLSANTSYSYRLRAKNSAGTSAYTAYLNVKTTVQPPATPTNVRATATADTVTIQWVSVSGATGYDVLFNGMLFEVSTISKTFTGLTPGATYSYQVRAKNTGGASPYSDSKYIVTVPAQPTDVSATASETSVTIEWPIVPGASSYEVQFNNTVYVTSDTTITFWDLTPNTNYTYSVCAKNDSGASAYCPVQNVRTRLTTPTNIQAYVTIDSMVISWDAVAGATSYEIIFNNEHYEVIGNSKEFNGLIPETEYSYSLCAKNTYVTSLYSKTMTSKTLRAVPDVPQNVRATATINRITVRWDEVPDATEYEVAFDEEQNSAGIQQVKMIAVEEGGNELKTYRVFSGLLPDTTHTYRVRAKNQYGYGDYSLLQSISTERDKQNTLPRSSRRKTYPDGRKANIGLDPVNALTGAFLWSYTFLEDYGKDAMQFTLMYDSQRDEHCKVVGKGWTHALNYLLYQIKDYIYFSTPYDEVTAFHMEEGSSILLPDADGHSDYTLEHADDGTYQVKDLDGTTYVFDSRMSLVRILENGLVTCSFLANANGQMICAEGRYGGRLMFAYTDDKLTTVTDEMGNSVQLAYGGDHLVSVVNPGGFQMTFVYDGEDRVIEIKDFSGNTYLTNQYDIYDRVISQTMAGRGTSTAAYDEEQRITTFTDEDGNETLYHYNEAGNVTCVELAGTSVQSIYNERGQVVQQVDALGAITQMEYDDAGRMNSVIHPDGTTEQITYNDRNLPIHMINRDGTENTYSYDQRNNLISFQDERGNTCTYAYDSSDNLISFTDKEGNVWSYVYDNNNHLSEVSDPEGNKYLYVHDAIGRLTSYTTPMGRTTTYEYSATGELLQIVDAAGIQIFAYDSNGSCTGVTDRRGNSQHLEYNAMGQVVLATDFMGKEYHFAYDMRGNLIQETDPLGFTASYTYDAFGNRTSLTDKNGGVTYYTFDAANQLTQVTDAAGGSVSYTYDTMGRVTAVTDPLLHQTVYTYDQVGRILSETDAMGCSISYTYDQAGNVLTRTDQDGVVTSYTYDKENRLLTILNQAGLTSFTYDALGRVVSVLDTDGYTESIQYDGDDNLIASTDKESRQTSYTYDEMGRLAEQTDPNGGKTTYAYDSNGNCTQITDAENHVYTYEYDANNRLTKITDPLGQETIRSYDDRGQLTSVTDANGGVTKLSYDGNGNLVCEINPLSGERIYTYDAMNRLISSTDEEGNTCAYTYDAAGNRTSFTDANQNTWTYEYDANNRLISITDKNEDSVALSYTNTGRISTVTDSEGAETSYQYDALGRITQISDAMGHSLSFTYDSIGRMLTQTDANGNTTEYSYSPTGNLLQILEPEGGSITYTYNELGQVLTKEDALGNMVSYAYNLLGQVTSMTDALGNVTSFTYTPNGQIAAVVNAEGNTIRYIYDACGNLVQTEDALGNVVMYEYDAMNNRIKECMNSSGEQICATLYQYDKKGRVIKEITPILEEKVYNYDGNDNLTSFLDEERKETIVTYDLNNQPVSITYSDGRAATFRYNKRGELVELQDWNGTVSMSRDDLGRLTSVTDHNGRTTGFTYDAVGNRTGISYPDGSAVAYAYDGNNRLVQVTDTQDVETQYTYDTAGNVASVIQPGSTAAYAYNANRQPVKVNYQLGADVFMEENLTYDSMGRITTSQRTGSAAEFIRSASYAYDALGQLTTYQVGQKVENYTYDALGNRRTKSLNGIQCAAYQYNMLNQLTSMVEDDVAYSFAYDKRGNLTEEYQEGILSRQYSYDTAGRMVLGKNLVSGEETAYTYNALQMRIGNVQKLTTAEGFRTREMQYVPDFMSVTNNELMAYETGAGSVRTVFGHAYQRLSQNTASGKTFFQSDIYGSPIFAADGQGGMQQYAERDIWGGMTSGPDILSGLEENLRFTSYQFDPVVRKYFAQARFYDRENGRMLAKDPVKRGLNQYRYCDNDPVDYVDPTGEVLNIVGGAVVGGFLGAVGGFVSSAISQGMSGGKIDWKKARGAAANGAIVGAAQGAMVGSGVGIPAALAVNFLAGTAGSAAEQYISEGKVDARKSITSGLTNAVSNAIYGTNPLGSVEEAFLRGLGAGAATSAINYISDFIGQEPVITVHKSGRARGALLAYGLSRDPRRGCGSGSPFVPSLGYSSAKGYQYDVPQTESFQTQQKKFSLWDFAKETLIGGLTGGFSSAAFYGVDKGIEKLKEGFRTRKGGSGTGTIRNWKGEEVKIPDGHIMSPRDPDFSAKPITEAGPYTLTQRDGFLAGNSAGTKLAPHHRHQIPVRDGGIIDEIPGPGHPKGNQHTGGTPNRHPAKSIFNSEEGGKALRAAEIKEHWINKGKRLKEILPGVWIDPGF